MILHKTLHRTLKDSAKLETFDAGGFAELVLEVPGNAADTRYGKFTTAIGSDMTGEKRTEIVNHKVVDGRHVYVIMDVFGEGAEETVGQRLTIHTVDDDGQGESCLSLEIGLKSIRQSTAVEVVNEPFAEHGPTTLVADDISQGWRVLNNLSTIIKTRISARP
jgi:hypothetical protein